MRLVEQVHEEIIKLIKPGDFAIDATVGNGHDTLFLAACEATVIGFDIQDLAIENTKRRLLEAKYLNQVTLHKKGHEQMLENIPDTWIGNVHMIMFNLGYLPGGDKALITQPNTTLQALEVAYTILKKNGYLSLVLYPDHEGGSDEASQVKTWITNNAVSIIQHLRSAADRGPEWFLVQNNKRKADLNT